MTSMSHNNSGAVTGTMSGELSPNHGENYHRSVTENDKNQGVDSRMIFTPYGGTSAETGGIEGDFDQVARVSSTMFKSKMRGSLKSINNRAGFRQKLR